MNFVKGFQFKVNLMLKKAQGHRASMIVVYLGKTLIHIYFL